MDQMVDINPQRSLLVYQRVVETKNEERQEEQDACTQEAMCKQ